MGEHEDSPVAALLDIDKCIKQFLSDLKKEKIKFPSDIACESIKLLERIVTNSEWETAKDLMKIVKEAGEKMTKPQYSGSAYKLNIPTIISNMVKRVLKVIRDEYYSALGKDDEYDQEESLQKMLVAEEQIEDFFVTRLSSLKKSISANLRELMEEFNSSLHEIARQSDQHINSDEKIMTFGYSRTVENFLKAAAAERQFQVLLLEGAPSLGGHDLAKSLAESGIPTAVIPDGSAAAYMNRVNKVIVGTHCVMATGGLKATCGIHGLAISAKCDAVPFIALASSFKLTPEYVTSSDQEGFNHMLPPEDLIPFEDDELRTVEILNPAYDYVPPELINLIIFNSGPHTPADVSRLLKESYHRNDYEQTA